ncbi:MAG: pyruvate:ferredoxin (flavodoxin) oxidoreductase [Bacilli bacterium]|nr:pyruvate:ferredoxin (flavodoxin) oxidoreductase [Bacilli bacterium]
MYKIIDGNEACSYVSYKFTEVAGIYPITPASPMAEMVDKESSTRKNFFGNPVRVVEMQSEAGAAGMVHGSLLSGALTTTYTASQGLLLMIPNMYKIAGEGLPLVIHVASRSLATHALSIMGDHQDIYAARSTGFAMLASSSPQQVMDLTSVAHLAAIKAHVPFMHFFDGFRTSHELSKVEVIDLDEVYKLIDFKELDKFRNRALNIDKPATFGTCQMDDVYFQVAEAKNKKYESLPDVVNNYMESINSITKRDYKPFNYYGSCEAENIIVAMGSVCETVKETIDYLNSQGLKYGLIEVHLYRPFSSKYFLKVLPSTVKKIAVLDRTKEPGSNAPLYLDVLSIIKENNLNIEVYGGRYGLSGKDTAPSAIKAVFDNLSSNKIFNNFTIGIYDDVTNLSLKIKKFNIPSKNYEMLIYGFASDGMVSASKDIIKITGNGTNAYVQGYFEYDSKKSGGVTISHLRFGKNPIGSSYYVNDCNTLVVTKDSYLKKYDIVSKLKENGIFILNTSRSPLELLTNRDKEYIRKHSIKMYVIDAESLASSVGLGGKISSIMEILIFKLCHILDYNYAINEIKDSLEKKFKNKGNDILEKNLKAISLTSENFKEVKITKKDIGEIEIENEEMTLFDVLESRMGNRIPVSSFLSSIDGMTPPATSSFERRYTSNVAPVYIKENCISCNMCSFVCPHGVIRPYLLSDEEYESAPNYVRERCIETSIKSKLYKFTVAVNVANCTGCGLCINTCPGKKGNKALDFKESKILISDKEQKRFEYLEKNIKEKDVLDKYTIKGSQLIKPKFSYPGACAGCGETSYLKLISQLFGSNMVVANATGCSSIYSASYPVTTYNTPWANSLFEDNAEFGMGMKIADMTMKDNLKSLLKEKIKKSEDEISELFDNYLAGIDGADKKLYEYVYESKDKDLMPYKNFIKNKTFFIIGGDGWAYDIGFSGIDHVLASGLNVNILVLDTEVYSNTGGQASKSSHMGAVAKFAASGKTTNKKDLASIAMTYKNAFVGTISMGANMNHTIKTLRDAVLYDGPSLIIAYSPCISHGILKGMSNTMEEEKLAVESGYFPLFKYHPLNGFSLDSKADFTKYYEFVAGEDRYRTLKKLNPDNYKELLENDLENSKDSYNKLEKKVNNDEVL